MTRNRSKQSITHIDDVIIKQVANSSPLMEVSKKPTFVVNEESAYTKALLRSLSFAQVKFIRYTAVDPFNTLRCKALPVDSLLKNNSKSLQNQVTFVRGVFGGLPSFGDVLQASSGLDASDSVVLEPDLNTLRILPYAKNTAITLGYLFDHKHNRLSDLCCRGLLKTFVDQTAKEHQLSFNVGAELEFCLVHPETKQPVDWSNFADSVLLNRQQDLLVDLLDQLKQQEIDVELIHAESAPGQLEIVLTHQKDPLRLVDHVVLARETVRQVVHHHGLQAIFLPKPYRDQAGNGCHLHISMYNTTTGENLFRASTSPTTNVSRSDISATGQSFMEGILQHLPALLAVSIPTANSFGRVGKGCWTGHQVSWALDDKEAPLRVVGTREGNNFVWDHVEFKLCDSQANLYLALACILRCGVEGIQQELHLRPPRHGNDDPALPEKLSQSLDCLEEDDLLKAFIPPTLMQAYVNVRRVEEGRASE